MTRRDLEALSGQDVRKRRKVSNEMEKMMKKRRLFI
jgi:hypothetical protein